MMNKGGCLIRTWSLFLPKVWELQEYLKGAEQKFVTDVSVMCRFMKMFWWKMECFQPEGMKFDSGDRKKGQGFHETNNKFSFCSRTSFAWRNSEILVYFILNKYHMLSSVFVWGITIRGESQVESGCLSLAVKKD